MAYATGLALGIMAGQADKPDTVISLLRWQKPLLLVPAVCWLLHLINLMRGDESWYSRLQKHRSPRVVIFTATIFFGLGLGLLLLPFEWLPRGFLVAGVGIDLMLLGAAVAFLDAFDEGESLLPHFARSFSYALVIPCSGRANFELHSAKALNG